MINFSRSKTNAVFFQILFFTIGFVGALAGRCEARNRLGADTQSASSGEDDLWSGLNSNTIGISYLVLTPRKSDQFEKGQGLAGSWIGHMGARYGTEVLVGHYQQQSKDGPELLHGQNSVWPIQVNIRYYPVGHRGLFEPFFFGGGGYYLIHHQMDQNLNEQLAIYGASFNESISNSFGYQFGGGLFINIAPDGHLKIGLDYRYVGVPTTVNYTLNYLGQTFSGAQDVDLGGNMYTLGAYYSF